MTLANLSDNTLCKGSSSQQEGVAFVHPLNSKGHEVNSHTVLPVKPSAPPVAGKDGSSHRAFQVCG